MEATAQKEIVQSAHQPTEELHKGVSGQLNRAGYNTTPTNLNPEDESILQKLSEGMGEAKYRAETTLAETIGGHVDYIRETEGNTWRNKLARRLHKLWK